MTSWTPDIVTRLRRSFADKLALRKRISNWRRAPRHEGQAVPQCIVEFPHMSPEALPERTHDLTPFGSTDSLPTSCNAEPKSRRMAFNAQKGSSFFTKLPPELRLQIYTEVLGNRKVHILLKIGSLSHVVCYEPWKEDWWRHSCMGLTWEGVGTYVGNTKEGKEADGGKLELLRSCRRVYAEAIDLLYSTSLFDIGQGSQLIDLANTILPKRLACIRALELRYFHSSLDPNGKYKHYDDVVEILKSMTGLKELKLELSTEKPAALTQGSTTVEEKRLLEPLKEITHIKQFVVEVNWLRGEQALDEEEAQPFVLRRLTHR